MKRHFIIKYKTYKLESVVRDMELFLSSIGFSKYQSMDDISILADLIIEQSTERYISNYGTDVISVEYYKSFGKDIGLLLTGQLDEKENVIAQSIIPIRKGKTVTDTFEVEVTKAAEKNIYYGYCEENKSGTPVTFYIQNIVDYLDIKEGEEAYINGIELVAMSIDGTVILPINKSNSDALIEEEEDKWREELVSKAREGDEDAIELLEIDALETAEIIHERLVNEDLLSILDGFFIPYGQPESLYSLLGTIQEVEEATNEYSNEEIYILTLNCMGIELEVCINKKNLVGSPSVGMRFKGTCWVQGHIEFC